MDPKDFVDEDFSEELPTKSVSTLNNTLDTPIKTTRYRQCYRVEWESMPDFKDWLKPVVGEPTRAFCTYCNKSLHAHRLSLLKHTCTLKHTKAALSVYALKMAANITETLHQEETEESAKSADAIVEVGEDTNSDEEAVDDPSDADLALEFKPPIKIARIDTSPVPLPKSKLSTYVMDTAKGLPVGGLQVSLYKLVDSRWRIISEGFTNPDGRFSDFIQTETSLSPGRYKMHYDVDRYFELRKQESLYPFIEIVFDVKSPRDYYHIPLLLSPFGYTTYRGS